MASQNINICVQKSNNYKKKQLIAVLMISIQLCMSIHIYGCE